MSILIDSLYEETMSQEQASEDCPDKPLVYRINENGEGPELLRQIFLERGWHEYDSQIAQSPDHWNIWWRTSHFRNNEFDIIFPWQRLNHHPKSTAITKKDSLARHMKRMKCVYGNVIYNFFPLSFNLPNDFTRFVSVYSKMRYKAKSNRKLLWICKPADLSCGRGIFLFRDISELQYDCNAVVQRYVANPYLISGYKFDLRIYVLVPSFHPLTIYIYQEGLVRFSTEKFNLDSINNIFSHLTNTSINKYSPGYTIDKERVGPGCKWTLTQLRYYFRQINVDDQSLWAKVINIVILTLLSQASQVPPKFKNCFELYGFDILIDENMKPWLLEVNFSPALCVDCQADVLVKKPLLHDLFDLINFKPSDADFGKVQYPMRNPYANLMNKATPSLYKECEEGKRKALAAGSSERSRPSNMRSPVSRPSSRRSTASSRSIQSAKSHSEIISSNCDDHASMPTQTVSPKISHSDGSLSTDSGFSGLSTSSDAKISHSKKSHLPKHRGVLTGEITIQTEKSNKCRSINGVTTMKCNPQDRSMTGLQNVSVSRTTVRSMYQRPLCVNVHPCLVNSGSESSSSERVNPRRVPQIRSYSQSHLQGPVVKSSIQKLPNKSQTSKMILQTHKSLDLSESGSNYCKAWDTPRNHCRKVYNTRSISTVNGDQRPKSQERAKQVGDFFLVYPFTGSTINTKPTSIQSLDIGASVQASHRRLKAVLDSLENPEKGPAAQATELWSPVHLPCSMDA